MKVLMLWQLYHKHFEVFYNKYPDIRTMPFEQHQLLLYEECYGWPFWLAQFMDKCGIQKEFVILSDGLFVLERILKDYEKVMAYLDGE